MGGSSSSTSSQSNSQTSEVNDSRVAVESGGIGVGSGATVDVAITDGGIAKDLASASGDIADALGGGWEAMKRIGQGFADTATTIIKDNNKILADNKTDSAKDIAKTTIQMVMGVMVVVVVASVWLITRKGK